LDYRIDKDYIASVRYESNNYCLLCGEQFPGLVSNISGIRQFVVSGIYKRYVDDIGISIGPQYIIGFLWYGDSYRGEKIETPNHRFGIGLGVSFRRISLKIVRRIPKNQHNGDVHFSIGVLLGKYRGED